jgi:vacuolar protein sorting-associated protein 13A/C
MALTVDQLGMSLRRMGSSSEVVRFLDDVDMTFSLDTRASSSSQRMTSIEITSKPIIFRASYRDINLISSIVNKAVELSNRSQSEGAAAGASQNTGLSSSGSLIKEGGQSHARSQSPGVLGRAKVITTMEQVKAFFCIIIRLLNTCQVEGVRGWIQAGAYRRSLRATYGSSQSEALHYGSKELVQ